ncbi:hypothetical protein HQ560_05990, partial [bacterium]|nr:hypothetical protein [bacterium]
MLTLRPDQFELFRRPVRKREAKLLLQQLDQLGVRADLDPKTGDLRARNALGQITRIAFRDDGLPARIIEPSGLTHGVDYDARGRLRALIFPGGRRLEVDRNADGDITALRRPDLCAYEFEYQPGIPFALLRMPDGRELKFLWATNGQLLRVVDRARAETTLALSTQANVRAVTDPLERVTVYLTNDSGEVEGVLSPDGGRETYALDPQTQVLTVTRRDESQVRFTHGPTGKSTRIEWGDDDALEVEYGEDGSMARAVRGEVEVAFERD